MLCVKLWSRGMVICGKVHKIKERADRSLAPLFWGLQCNNNRRLHKMDLGQEVLRHED
jgi:hypothetical protein